MYGTPMPSTYHLNILTMVRASAASISRRLPKSTGPFASCLPDGSITETVRYP